MTPVPKPTKAPKTPKRLKRGKRPAKVRKTSRGQWKEKADTAFATWVKDRDGWTCTICHRSAETLPRQAIQCGHIWSRRYLGTRFDPENAVTLCWFCHRFWTEHSDLWELRRRIIMGYDRYHRVRDRAFAPCPKLDYEAIYRAIQNGDGHYAR